MPNANSNYFKKYNRENRVQLMESTFKDGIFYTKAPLDAGKARLLVNYDLMNEGASLSVRKGMRTECVYAPFTIEKSVVGSTTVTSGKVTIVDATFLTQLPSVGTYVFTYATTGTTWKYNGNAVSLATYGITLTGTPANDNTITVVVAEMKPALLTDLRSHICREIVTEDNKHYKLAIVGQYKSTDTAVSNSNLKSAPHEMWVMKEDNLSSANCLDEYDIKSKDMYAFNISNKSGSSTQKSYYYVPNIEKINGMAIADKTYISRTIGCFAWDDNYYNFNDAGKLIRSRYDTSNTKFISEEMTPMKLTVKEAYSTGFNMLLDQPYAFSDENISGSIQLDGLLLLDDNNEIAACPLINKTYKMRIYHRAQASKKYKFIIKYRETDTGDWTTIKTEERTITSPITELSTNFTSPVASIVMQVEAYLYSGSAYATTPENILTVGASFSATGIAERTNQKLVKINIHKASEMVYWKNYIWLYGMSDAPKTLFRSAINEPTYFPYPNNTNIFEEPIIHCVPFKESMLVFTKSKLLQITLSDGTFYQNIIQDGLNFTDFDASMVRCVKNMVFFKSGEYYYMVVPKTLSLQNEFALAPVSKNIEYFLDNFEENILDMIDIVYDYGDIIGETLTLVHHYNYLNYEDVYNTYVFATNKNVYINVVLLYNTNDRTWRFYTYESESVYTPIREDATKVSEMYTPTPIKINIDGTETTTVAIQQFFADESTARDFFIPKNSVFKKTSGSWVADDGVIETAFDTLHTFKNWAILDTGYRNSDIDYNKRYRELQFKFNNTSGANIKFSIEFVLDGETRINKYTYGVEQITDPTDDHYGLIYVSRTPVENLELPGETALGIDSSDINAWTLENSMFPEIAFWKARMRVSGKGYTPRFRLMARTEERYEIIGYNWVYRLLYSR